MANRFPLIVDSSNQNIKELPDGDSLLLGDSEKLLLGDGTDLQLYHDGSNSYLANSTGALKLATETSGIAVTIGHTTSEVTIADNLTVTGTLTLGSGAELAEAELEMLDGITAGTVAASKAVVVDANKDAGSFRNITLTGELDAATLDISGNSDLDGTLSVAGAMTSETSAKITQVAITSSSNAVAWDAAAAANAYHVTTENTTFSAPSNAVEGAIISVELAQGGTARTVAWNTVFEFAASTAPTVTATANKTDIFAFRYNGSVWQEIGRVQNMAQT
tara:strand:+ start:1053 stop:1883 length:831 start_codon:yes stop_codon:yes gene_type:complete